MQQKKLAILHCFTTPTAQSTATPTSVANSAPETSTPCVGFEPTDLVVGVRDSSTRPRNQLEIY